jgi:hypothetical protein
MTKKAAPPVPPIHPDRRRRARLAALLNPSSLLATTALPVAIETKLPPYRGD